MHFSAAGYGEDIMQLIAFVKCSLWPLCSWYIFSEAKCVCVSLRLEGLRGFQDAVCNFFSPVRCFSNTAYTDNEFL